MIDEATREVVDQVAQRRLTGLMADPDEVVTFGFFDGTIEELERSQDDADYAERRASIDPLVETTVVNGVYEVVTSMTKEGVAG